MLETWQGSGEVICSVTPAVQRGNLHSTGCILISEWQREHGLRASFVEGMATSRKVGPGR